MATFNRALYASEYATKALLESRESQLLDYGHDESDAMRAVFRCRGKVGTLLVPGEIVYAYKLSDDHEKLVRNIGRIVDSAIADLFQVVHVDRDPGDEEVQR
jgi:hypothetical protein